MLTWTPQRRIHVTYTLLGLLAIILVGQIAFYRLQKPATVAHAVWDFEPKTFTEVKDRAQTIVQAEVIKVERGDDIVTKVDGEPNNEDRLPTQKVTLKVIKGYKGNTAEKATTITLFQTGGEVVLPPAPAEGEKAPEVEGAEVIFEGDPLYKVGEQYFLMLEPGPNNMQRIVSPAGRYLIESNGQLKPMVESAVTDEVKGKSLTDLEREKKITEQK